MCSWKTAVSHFYILIVTYPYIVVYSEVFLPTWGHGWGVGVAGRLCCVREDGQLRGSQRFAISHSWIE